MASLLPMPGGIDSAAKHLLPLLRAGFGSHGIQVPVRAPEKSGPVLDDRGGPYLVFGRHLPALRTGGSIDSDHLAVVTAEQYLAKAERRS